MGCPQGGVLEMWRSPRQEQSRGTGTPRIRAERQGADTESLGSRQEARRGGEETLGYPRLSWELSLNKGSLADFANSSFN